MSGRANYARWAFFIVALSCAVVAIACLAGNRYWIPRVVLSCRISGYVALAFLAFTLAIPALARLKAATGTIVSDDKVRLLTKQCGCYAALLSVIHGSIVTSSFVEFDWLALWQVTYLRSGVAAASILLLLWISSFERLTRWLGWRLFKPLHRLSYVASALVLHHMLLSPFASRWWTLIIFASLCVVLLMRFLPQRNRL